MEWGLYFREYFRGTLVDSVSMGHKVRRRRTHEGPQGAQRKKSKQPFY